MNGLKIEREVHFGRKRRNRKTVEPGPAADPMPEPTGTVPRVSRLMALAIRFHRLIQVGEVTDQAELARLGHVSRARMTQIMNLLHLAPDIQEEVLFLPLTHHDRDAIREIMLRPIAAVPDWRKQRRMWRALLAQRSVLSD